MSSVTALGSWPGLDIRPPLRIVRDTLAFESPDGTFGIPYLPELPDRGPGADLIGRTAGLLADLPVDLQPSGWRLVDRPGRDAERIAALMRRDLDELAETFDGYRGRLKLQVAGPWTLAAELRVARGERVVVDPGACRDLVQSLAEGVRRHGEAVRRLVPGASLVVQLDEPSLPAVLAGRLPTSSGYGTHRAVDAETVRAGLREVVAGARAVGSPEEDGVVVAVHCCVTQPPLALLRESGCDAVSIDTTLLSSHGWESVAATVESGTALWAGIAPGDARTTTAAVLAPLRRSWSDVGLPVGGLDGVTLTPTCGLAGASPDRARSVHDRLVEAARALTEIASS